MLFLPLTSISFNLKPLAFDWEASNTNLHGMLRKLIFDTVLHRIEILSQMLKLLLGTDYILYILFAFA